MLCVAMLLGRRRRLRATACGRYNECEGYLGDLADDGGQDCRAMDRKLELTRVSAEWRNREFGKAGKDLGEDQGIAARRCNERLKGCKSSLRGDLTAEAGKSRLFEMVWLGSESQIFLFTAYLVGTHFRDENSPN